METIWAISRGDLATKDHLLFPAAEGMDASGFERVKWGFWLGVLTISIHKMLPLSFPQMRSFPLYKCTGVYYLATYQSMLRLF